MMRQKALRHPKVAQALVRQGHHQFQLYELICT